MANVAITVVNQPVLLVSTGTLKECVRRRRGNEKEPSRNHPTKGVTACKSSTRCANAPSPSASADRHLLTAFHAGRARPPQRARNGYPDCARLSDQRSSRIEPGDPSKRGFRIARRRARARPGQPTHRLPGEQLVRAGPGHRDPHRLQPAVVRPQRRGDPHAHTQMAGRAADYVETSRPEASAHSPASMPRPRPIKLEPASSSLGQPLSIGSCVLAGRTCQPYFHTGR